MVLRSIYYYYYSYYNLYKLLFILISYYFYLFFLFGSSKAFSRLTFILLYNRRNQRVMSVVLHRYHSRKYSLCSCKYARVITVCPY